MTATITPDQIRILQLAAQGLLEPFPRPAVKLDVLETIRRMGALQIDTISVIARSPYMVLFSRLGDYQPEWLDALLAEGDLFEYWSHAACFLPREDYPLYRRMMLDEIRGGPNTRQWLDKRQALVNSVLSRIQAEGGLRSADFERQDGKSSGWWDWKEEKIALEQLFTTGAVTIARREKFQRVYDLTERVIPDLDRMEIPSYEEVVRQLTLKAVRCLGAAPARWVPDYFRLSKVHTAAALKSLIADGQLVKLRVNEWDEDVLLHPDDHDRYEQAAAGTLVPTLTTLLTPFDPLVWDRARARELFNFDYTIECYLPAAKRKYGYFGLPVLHRGALVGRMDAKAHRKEGIFEIKALYLEPGTNLTAELGAELAAAIQRCADWHRTPQVILRRADPPEFAGLLEGIEVVELKD